MTCPASLAANSFALLTGEQTKRSLHIDRPATPFTSDFEARDVHLLLTGTSRTRVDLSTADGAIFSANGHAHCIAMSGATQHKGQRKARKTSACWQPC